MRNNKKLILVLGLMWMGSWLSQPAWAEGPAFVVDISITNESPDIRFIDSDANDADWEICTDDNGCFSVTGTSDRPLESFNIGFVDGASNGVPFTIENGTGTNTLYLDSAERVGINTNVPAVELDIRSTSPEIRLDDTSASAGQVDLQINTNEFTIEGNTGQDIFEMDTRAPADSLNIDDLGQIGFGTSLPERQLHLSGSNAVFRMDRSTDTAAFMLVRTDLVGAPLKTFVVGTNASGANTGEFVINDLGTDVGGPGARRLTITNTGDAQFTGNVQAPAFVTTSSRRFKENVERLSDALAVTQQLRGVRFNWKDTGRSALGLIAEEVAPVLPEVVERDAKDGQLMGVNYQALVAVLVEAVKEQQQQMESQEIEHQKELASLKVQMAEFAIMKSRLTEIESLVAGGRLQTVMVQR